MGNSKNKPIEVTAPSEEEEFYITWGRETLKNNLTFANEVLRQLVTINASLLGGSIILLSSNLIDSIFKAFAILFFFVALIFSFIGMMPYEGSVDLRKPDEIRDHKTSALNRKRFFLWSSGILTALGFLFALIGIIMHKP